jgi:hypothetical protein
MALLFWFCNPGYKSTVFNPEYPVIFGIEEAFSKR